MVKMSFPSRWVAAALFLCAAHPFAGVFTEQPKNLVEERAYAGVLGNFCDISRSGNFNGYEAILPGSSTAPQELNLVPRIKRHAGAGLLVGYRLNAYALEVSYWRSVHIAEWGTDTTYQSKATYQSVNIDLKRYVLLKTALQPFVAAGLSIPWLDVKDASYPYPIVAGVAPSNATYTGLGFNLSAGLEYYINQQFSVFGGIQQRWAGYNQVKGYYRQVSDVQVGTNDSFNLRGNGVNFFAGATVTCF